MSNDLRFFLVRLGLFIVIAVEALLLMSVVSKAQLPADQRGGFFGLQLTGVFVLILLTIPLAVYYYYLKSKRWDELDSKSQDQVDVETLAAYSHENRHQG